MTDERVEVPLPGAALPPQLLEALARGVAAAFAPPQPAPSVPGETVDFLTAGQFAGRLGVSRETVRRLAIANVLPCTVVCVRHEALIDRAGVRDHRRRLVAARR